MWDRYGIRIVPVPRAKPFIPNRRSETQRESRKVVVSNLNCSLLTRDRKCNIITKLRSQKANFDSVVIFPYPKN